MQRQLADGLILRTLSEGYASDRAQLPEFYGEVNAEGDTAEQLEMERKGLIEWTLELMDGHPTTTLDDIFVVVDPAHNDRIVSATLLIPQTWRYEEIPITAGRPELVGTRLEYRGRGLVRQLFEAVHDRSAALGHQLQGITGIPYFYRQFGYTMAVDLGDHASFPLYMVSEPAPEHRPAFTLRPATVDDIAALSAWYETMARDRLLTELLPPEQWRYEVCGHRPGSLQDRAFLVIVNAEGEGVGYIEFFPTRIHKEIQVCFDYVVGEQSSYLETFEDVMRGVKQWALATTGACSSTLLFVSGIHKSLAYLIEHTRGGIVNRQSYKWYLRVPDPVAFLQQIRPVLERRLEGSGAHRYTGEFKIGFHNVTGICLKFERGRISEIIPMRATDGYDAAFQWHLFWNVVFGDHSHEEISALLPDVWTDGKGAVLLDALFPKRKSWLNGLR